MKFIVGFDLDNYICETTTKEMIHIRVVLDCEEDIYGGANRDHALGIWLDSRRGGEAKGNLLLGRAMWG